MAAATSQTVTEEGHQLRSSAPLPSFLTSVRPRLKLGKRLEL